MKASVFKLGVLGGMLVGLPLAGVVAAGLPIARYLEFPPKTRYVQHAPFSATAFAAYAVFIACVVLPLGIHAIRHFRQGPSLDIKAHAFPWWGWLGAATGAASWTLAWNRFTWFAPFQPHTFTPLWLSYILVVNGLTFSRTGRCMMCHRTRFFLVLFPFSAAFWWFFEYLNRFVQNWEYTGAMYPAWEYFLYATIPFSTVLPAVLGTRDWVLSFQWIESGFRDYARASFVHAKGLGWTVLFISGAGLFGIGIWPDILFPLLWISPLLIIVSLQIIMGELHIFSNLIHGDWRFVVSAALAALCCGFFWEMWNFHSLARWSYHVPLVQRFQIFEMPVLGYAGYLPFGLECAVVGEMIYKITRKYTTFWIH